MAELADALASGASGSNTLRVRLPPRPQYEKNNSIRFWRKNTKPKDYSLRRLGRGRPEYDGF